MFFIVYDSIQSKYTKLEESFGGFIERCLLRFEYEKSPLHALVYGGTGTGRTFLLDNNKTIWRKNFDSRIQSLY